MNNYIPFTVYVVFFSFLSGEVEIEKLENKEREDAARERRGLFDH